MVSVYLMRRQMPIVGESGWERESVTLPYLEDEKGSQMENWLD